VLVASPFGLAIGSPSSSAKAIPFARASFVAKT